MEDTELEEGEAWSYQNNEDFDSNIDPDIALSYIDVKLQHVLGHFQKDFEGGVSAENLGAKFGGYGSFLPSYQRSPVWSHSRTPPKGHNCSTSRSPNNFHQEVGHNNSVVSSTTPQSIRPGPPSTSSTSLPIIKVPNLNESSKQEVCTSFQHVDELAAGYGCTNNKSTTSSDQISLKVRIKMGSDNLSTRKNDEIYCGLGLDVSPSSSLDDSPSESEGISRELQDGPFESPTSILQMMTSFPVHGGFLLSPLPDDLIHLTQTGKPAREKKSTRVQHYNQDRPVVGGSSLKSGQMLPEKRTSKDMNDFFSESKNTNRKDFLNGSVTSKKTSEIDSAACEELVSNALKLPLLANSYAIAGETTKTLNGPSEILMEADKVVARDRHFFYQLEEGPAVEPPLIIEDEKQNNGSSGKVKEPKKASKFDDISVPAKKSGESKREKTIDLIEAASKGKNASNGDQIDPLKLNTNHKISLHAHNNMKYASGKDHLLPEGKKKSKFSHTESIPNGEVSKRSMKSGSSGSKTKSISKTDNIPTRTEIEDHKPQDFKKTKDRYRDFFGELEEDDNLIDTSENPFDDQLNHSDVFGKSTPVIPMSKERLSVEKIGKSSASKSFPEAVMNPASGTVSDAAPAAVDNVNGQDNWVCCDRCQQWRLLPLGTNPASLPEKWICSMLDWLPGMNQCIFSEEETTKALIARFQAPAAPEGTIYSNLSGVMPGVANARQSEHNHRHYDFNVRPGGGKKKHGANERPSIKGDALQLSNPKKHEGAMKSRSLDDVNQLPVGDEANFHHLNKYGDVPVDKHKHKYKEKQESVDILSDEGATKILKTKNRKEKEQDYSRPVKKVRTDGLDLIDEDQISVHSGPVVKVDPTLSVGFPSASGGTNKSKSMDHSSKDSKYNMNVIPRVPNDKRENKQLGVVDDDSLGGGSGSTKSNSKKRKGKASPDIQINPGSFNGSDHLLQRSGRGTSDDDHRKEKKAKLSKPPGKESSGRKEKKGSHSKNLPFGQDVGSTLSHRSLDGVDSKRDLGAIQPSLVATSSSSKISGSHKTKSSFQEMKGSPVESVSSSPMRIPNRDKILRSSREGKDFLDADRTRCSDGEEEDGGSDRSGTGSKKKSVVAHRRPLKSPLVDTLNNGASYLSGKKTKTKEKSSNVQNCDLPNGSLGNSGIDHQHPRRPWAEQVQNEDRSNEMRNRDNETYPFKSGKDLSSQLKDRNGSYCLDVGMDKDKVPYSHDDLRGRSPSHSDLKVKNGKHKLQDNSRIKSGDARKESSGKLSIERGKRESELNFVKHEGPDSTLDSSSKENVVLSVRKNQQQDSNGSASKRSLFQKNDQHEKISGKGTPVQFPTTGELQNQMLHGPPSAGGGKGSAIDVSQVDALQSNDVSKGKKHAKNRQKEVQTNGSRHSTPNARMPIDAPSPARRDSSNQAATKAMKEAKDLKHLADRFKNSGSNHESIGFYFQAALKFLYGASLLESSNNETAKQSIPIYSSTAKLCEFCAHEYEKIKDMAAAALAYKCMEVAFMRVVYSSQNTAIRDRNELQKALKMLPSGESPSSASDVDNLNNPGTAEKVAFCKGVSSSQANGSNIIAANNRPNFLRLLNYAQDVNFAMEASRKSRIAFAAANASSGGTTNKEGISCIKTALDFNFQDVEGLLALVRIAMEAINR
ncbi:cysteine-tryptophan domain-containing zinc finger protein 7-like isoform X1 [Cucumis melo]|uniref:Cysteine-tryptophan domain-containing zinc finger protein 7-like isoform X1 n=1 Tax=Cucumis melo TaxID=3656 RepID=A0A1S3BRW4_CUCME|nr:cysteine-tryptophan domain-containing zinc finger protein 7-like isoform X1 [Cucumis melo]